MSSLLQFWTVGVAGKLNNLTERYYTYDDARDAATRKAQIDPTNIYLILKLDGYVEGKYNVTITSEAVQEDIVLPANQYSIVGVTFVYSDGSYLNLADSEIQLLILPSKESDASEAFYDVIVDGTSEMQEVEYTFDSEVTAYPFTGWYKINIIKDGISTLYQEGNFSII